MPPLNLHSIAGLILFGIDYSLLDPLIRNLLTIAGIVALASKRSFTCILILVAYVTITVQNNDDIEETITTPKATAMTLHVYCLSQISVWQWHPLYWRLKMLMRHAVMFPKYLIYEA